jgi:hypothetical protein
MLVNEKWRVLLRYVKKLLEVLNLMYGLPVHQNAILTPSRRYSLMDEKYQG